MFISALCKSEKNKLIIQFTNKNKSMNLKIQNTENKKELEESF